MRSARAESIYQFSKSLFACLLQLFPCLTATLTIFKDNSKLGRECSQRTESAATTRREAVFRDRIDRRDSREFLKVTRAFPLPRVSRNVSRSMMRTEKNFG